MIKYNLPMFCLDEKTKQKNLKLFWQKKEPLPLEVFIPLLYTEGTDRQTSILIDSVGLEADSVKNQNM